MIINFWQVFLSSYFLAFYHNNQIAILWPLSKHFRSEKTNKVKSGTPYPLESLYDDNNMINLTAKTLLTDITQRNHIAIFLNSLLSIISPSWLFIYANIK